MNNLPNNSYFEKLNIDEIEGVEPLSAKELQNIDGGTIGFIGAAAYLVVGLGVVGAFAVGLFVGYAAYKIYEHYS